jgi:hypothetical protein
LDAQHKEQWKVNLELAAILTFTDPILHPGGPLP